RRGKQKCDGAREQGFAHEASPWDYYISQRVSRSPAPGKQRPRPPSLTGTALKGLELLRGGSQHRRGTVEHLLLFRRSRFHLVAIVRHGRQVIAALGILLPLPAAIGLLVRRAAFMLRALHRIFRHGLDLPRRQRLVESLAMGIDLADLVRHLLG